MKVGRIVFSGPGNLIARLVVVEQKRREGRDRRRLECELAQMRRRLEEDMSDGND